MFAQIRALGPSTVKLKFLPGIVGPANKLSIGTVATGAAGTDAAATITGTAPNQTLNLTIPRGVAGPPNALAIGTVTTGAPGSSADATITGTAPSQTLNLTLPRGEAGPGNALSIGTVTTGAAGSPAAATITGTSPNQTLNLTIPKGADGAGLTDGDKGDITVSGGGSSFTIDNNAVSLAKMADIATASILGRASAGTGDPETLTPVQARAILNLLSHGQCQLVKSGANLLLKPFDGNKLVIDGVPETVPNGGVSLAPPATNGTTYYIYAYMNAGAMTLEASTAGHVTNALTGVEMKSGDSTRTLVGMARTVSSAWVDTIAQRLVRSWFNRQPAAMRNRLTADRTTTSTTYTEINTEIRCEFLSWPGEGLFATCAGLISNSDANNRSLSALAVDAVATPEGTGLGGIGTLAQPTAISLSKSDLTEGYHFITLLGKVQGFTGTWFGTSSDFACQISAMLR